MNNSISKVLIIIVVFLLLSGMLLADKDKAIILEEKISYHIKNIDNAKLKVYKKIKILNKNGEGYSTIVIGENNYVKLKKVKGEVTDSNGKRLKKFDEDDFKKTNLSNINILMPEAWNKYFEYKHP
ncbi:MAG: hypothetical protein KAR38_00360, partial [Calditrichia bacterium]|nr:hypothetical protein [Calditrichia bacterium]